MKLLTIIYILLSTSLLTSCFEGGSKFNLSKDVITSPNGGVDNQFPSPGETDSPGSGRSDERETPLPRNPGDNNEDNPSDPTCGEPQWNIEELLRRIELLETKKDDWDEIIAEGLENYRIIEPILKKKCFACHDSDRGVPWYGKPFQEHNSVYHHYIDGIAALDFSTKFPLTSQGTNNQVALLNGIKNAVLDETMPLKVYTRFYPRRKITPQDKMAIKYWVEPLVEKIEAWEQKYIYDLEDIPLFSIKECEETPTPLPGVDIEAARRKVSRVFSAKCFRCHANGVSKGGLGDMQDFEKLKMSKYINLETPDLSELYMISESGEMPPSIRDRLNREELQTILEWIRAEADIIK